MIRIFDDLKDFFEDVQEKLDYSQVQGNRNNYYELRDKVKLIIKDLTESHNKLTLVSKKIVNFYSVDGISGDDNFLDNTRKDINDMCIYLENSILPEIERKINELSNQIENIY